jgi:hypothetical protein
MFVVAMFIYVLLESTKEDGHYAFKNDWMRDKKTGEMVLVNKALLALYSKVGKIQMKKFMSKLVKGGNVMRISLPVIIFSNISQLQHLAHNRTFAIKMFKRAARMKDPIEQFKCVCAAVIMDLHKEVVINKPFNPILGMRIFVYPQISR